VTVDSWERHCGRERPSSRPCGRTARRPGPGRQGITIRVKVHRPRMCLAAGAR
jgi:hypothetical protein